MSKVQDAIRAREEAKRPKVEVTVTVKARTVRPKKAEPDVSAGSLDPFSVSYEPEERPETPEESDGGSDA